MARWMLIEPHYLNVEGTKWEYIEIDRGTGKQVRRQYPVPRFLDPADPSEWTEKVHNNQGQPIDGKIIVSDGNNANASDIIFEGHPTPNMLPLDEEAKAISARYHEVWKAPVENATLTHSQSLLDKLERQVAMVQTQQPQSQGMDQLMSAMAAMMKQNQELLVALTGRAVVNPTGAYEPQPGSAADVPVEVVASPKTPVGAARRV